MWRSSKPVEWPGWKLCAHSAGFSSILSSGVAGAVAVELIALPIATSAMFPFK